MESGAASAPDRRELVSHPLFPVALAIAFSPVLIDLAWHLWQTPWARGILVFPPLLWIATHLSGRAAPNVALVWAGLGGGLVVELLAVGGDVVRLGRIGLVLAVFGLLVGGGRARAQAGCLSLWLVPVPSVLLGATSPGLESFFARLAAGLPGLDHVVLHGRPGLVAAAERLDLAPQDGGLPLFVGLAGIGWFRAVVQGRSWLGSFRAAFACALLAVSVQAVVMLGAGALVLGGAGAAAARGILDHASWVVVVGLGLWAASEALPRRGSSGEELA